MRIIEITALGNGAHDNQTINGIIHVPDGWAVIPDTLDTPNYPSGDITVDETQTPPVVTSWMPLPIPEPGPASVDSAKAEKITEIKKDCEEYIYAGADVTYANGVKEHFTYTLADQSNISEMFTAVMAGATEYPYHADGEICKIYSKEQIVTIYGTLSLFKTEATTYHNSLKAQVNAMTDVDAINDVKFKETELTGEYLENYAAMMSSAKTQLEAVLARIPADETTTA